MTSSPRIVSLIASATEIVCALGLRNFMVGRSHECDFPRNITSLPVCTGPKFNPDGTSYEIDQKVKAILQESLSVYRVDATLLDELFPTHIITQSQCEVCAVSLRDVEEAACKLIRSQPQIISLQPNELSDVWRDIKVVAKALAVEERGEELVTDLQARMDEIHQVALSIPNQERVKVAYIEWIDPLMAGGNWMPQLINLAGADSPFGEAGKHSPPLEWSDVESSDPDVMLVAPCGFDIKRTLQDMHFLTERPGFSKLKALRNDRVYVADGNQYFNRPGPRLVESLEIIAEIAYPEYFEFGHQDTGWIPFALDTLS